ncbi:hypothetical protein SynMVIR181_01504 [Synechococcus sp. MVIR-18-1]|nr:hypothetical protein SynMVIR181_01504 [Synechococcus sp. MVIR-18-1]
MRGFSEPPIKQCVHLDAQMDAETFIRRGIAAWNLFLSNINNT